MLIPRYILSPIVQSAASLTADPGVVSSIPARTHALVEVDHEIIYSHSTPSTDRKKVVVSYKRKYVHKVLVNCLVKLAQERSVVR